MLIAGGAVTVTTTGTIALAQPFNPFSVTYNVVVEDITLGNVVGPAAIEPLLITTSSMIEPEAISPERERQT